ncbi:MAG: 16S rRNA (uracil(1498)-N(3))-methyltransferase [Acidobacteriota bacterium]
MHRCYVSEVVGHVTELPEDEAHHLTRVLRAEPGDEVVVFDGRAHEWLGRIVSIDRRRVVVDLLESRTPMAEPSLAVTLAAGLLKGDQMNTVVRDATALGVTAIQPIVSAHVAVPERAWRDRSADRWRRVAVSSAKQCGRAVVPSIGDIARLLDVLAAHASSTVVLCVEPTRAGASAAIPRPLTTEGRVLLCVGPEGGWAPDEIGAAQEQGAHLLTLGPRVLRAEMAPTVALTALWTQWGWT